VDPGVLEEPLTTMALLASTDRRPALDYIFAEALASAAVGEALALLGLARVVHTASLEDARA
jgi:hypothetical protein